MIEVILVSFGLIAGGFFTAAIIYYKKSDKQKSDKDLFVQELIDSVKNGDLKPKKT